MKYAHKLSLNCERMDVFVKVKNKTVSQHLHCTTTFTSNNIEQGCQ